MLWLSSLTPNIEGYNDGVAVWEQYTSTLGYKADAEPLDHESYGFEAVTGTTLSPDENYPNHFTGWPDTGTGISYRYNSQAILAFKRNPRLYPQLDRDFMRFLNDPLSSATAVIKFPQFKQHEEGLFGGWELIPNDPYADPPEPPYDVLDVPSGWTEIAGSRVTEPDPVGHENTDYLKASRDQTTITTGSIKLLYLGIYEVGGVLSKRILGESSVATATTDNQFGEISMLEFAKAYMDNRGNYMGFEIAAVPDIGIDFSSNPTNIEQDMHALHKSFLPLSAFTHVNYPEVITGDHFYMFGTLTWKNTMWTNPSFGAQSVAYAGGFDLPDTAWIPAAAAIGRQDLIV